MTDVAGARAQGIRRAGRIGAVSRLATAMLSVLILPVIARCLGADAYGVFAVLVTAATLLTFADLGLSQGLVSPLTALLAGGDTTAARRAVSNAAVMLVVVLLVVWPTTLGLALLPDWSQVLGTDLPRGDVRAAVLVFVGVFVVGVPFGLGLRVLQAHQRGDLVNWYLLGSSLASISSAALVALVTSDLVLVVLAYVVPLVLVPLVSVVHVWRRYAELRPRRSDVDRAAMVSRLRQGMLFLVLNVTVAVAFQSDVLVVAAVSGAATAGVFAIAVRMFSLVNQLVAAYYQQLWPAFADALARGDHDWVRTHLRTGIVRAAAWAVVVGGGLALVVRPAVGLLFGEEFVPGWLLVLALWLWTIQQSVGFLVAMLLNGAQVIGFQVVSGLLMAALNVSLSFVLAGSIGVSGPIWSSIVTHLVVVMVPSVYYIRRRVLVLPGA